MFEAINQLLNDSAFKAKVKYKTITYAVNDKIVEEGKMSKNMYLIKKGKARVIVHADLKANSAISPGIADLGPNDIFGEFGLFDDLPASADVIALTDCELIVIDLASFQEYLETDTQAAYKILVDMLKIFVKRLRHADKTIINLYAWGIKANKIDQYLE